jgi:hypothetical protein
MKDNGPSQLTNLESSKKKAAKKSSLQAGAIQGAINRRAAGNAVTKVPRPPILGPPARDAAGRLHMGSASLPSPNLNDEKEELKQRAKAELQRSKAASNTVADAQRLKQKRG